MVLFTKGEICYMAYISKKQQVVNILTDLENTITARNVDIGINILNWAKDKIILAERESKRQYYLQKDNTNPRNKPRVVKFGKVYGCNLGKNIGSEQNGKSRPVVILQKDTPNSPTVIVAPLTDAHDANGNLKTIYPTHVLVKDPKLTKESIIKLEHIRSVSKNRLTEYMTDLNDDEGVMEEVERKLKDMLCIK